MARRTRLLGVLGAHPFTPSLGSCGCFHTGRLQTRFVDPSCRDVMFFARRQWWEPAESPAHGRVDELGPRSAVGA